VSSYYVTPPRPPRLARRIIFGTLVGAVVFALVGGWLATRHVPVRIDGETVSVPPGVTVNDLVANGVVKARAGNLLAVDGSLLVTAGGEPPRVVLNGIDALGTERVFAGDAIQGHSGQDRRESVVVSETAIPFETIYRGKGSMGDIESIGVPGLLRRTLGQRSGIEVTRTVVAEPQPMVIVRSRPKPGARVVALTFDDGPWPGNTEKILDILAREHVHATFFLLGRQAGRLPSMARRELADGHMLGTHSYGHKSFKTLSPKGVRKQIARGEKAVKKATGVDTRWMRPPYGAMNGMSWKQAHALKQRVVLWDVDSRDWTKPGAKKIARNVVSHTRPGSIILMHDGGGSRGQTIAALPIIIRELRDKGYRFATVDDLVSMRKGKSAKAKSKK
jgi:peptidoglycan/xylan/chitin deacetylase (PgdA/CDA1 family)